MSCPRCGQAHAMPLLQCTACGFHVSDVQQLLGAGSVRVERLIDHAGCLSLRDSHYLNLALDDIERRFPQVFISVFLGSLPANVNAPQAAFWLLNHGTAIRNDQAKPGHWGIVLVLDLAQKQAGMAFGYSLEALLNLQTQNALLQDALPHFAHGEHRRGVLSVLTDLDKQLMRKGQSHRRAPASSDNADQSHLGLEQVHPATRPPTRLAGTLPPRR